MISPYTHLSHLQRYDLVEVTLLMWDLPVIHAENPTLRLWHTILTKTVVTERGLVLAESDWKEHFSEFRRIVDQLEALRWVHRHPKRETSTDELTSGDIALVILSSKSSESTPTTTDIQ